MSRRSEVWRAAVVPAARHPVAPFTCPPRPVATRVRRASRPCRCSVGLVPPALSGARLGRRVPVASRPGRARSGGSGARLRRCLSRCCRGRCVCSRLGVRRPRAAAGWLAPLRARLRAVRASPPAALVRVSPTRALAASRLRRPGRLASRPPGAALLCGRAAVAVRWSARARPRPRPSPSPARRASRPPCRARGRRMPCLDRT